MTTDPRAKITEDVSMTCITGLQSVIDECRFVLRVSPLFVVVAEEEGWSIFGSSGCPVNPILTRPSWSLFPPLTTGCRTQEGSLHADCSCNLPPHKGLKWARVAKRKVLMNWQKGLHRRINGAAAMASNEIITIINNSGKVISTGKQLVNIFKEAQAAYREKKDAVKAERAARAGIQRSKTFDVTPRGGAPPSSAVSADPYQAADDFNFKGGNYLLDDRPAAGRRKSLEDGDSQVSRSSRRSSQQLPARIGGGAPLLALTEGNLKTHSVVSSASPSKVGRNVEYPDPPTVVPSVFNSPSLPEPGHLIRQRTEPILPKKKKSIDMGLAYGDLPPDLADRYDLGPLRSPTMDRRGSASSPRSSSSGLGDEVNPEEAQALGLMDKIEDFLEEAHCVHHSASNMIATLQERPEAAAAVALSLAELSNLVGRLSPAFLAFLKGGSPAVFALLSSPQFLIGTGIAAGITVVMFGGWKIVKKMVEGASGGGARQMEAPMAMRAVPVPGNAQTVVSDATEIRPPAFGAMNALPAPPAAAAAPSNYDEGTVVEELSSVERWRRGISPGFGIGLDDDTEPPIPEVEMLSREAERVLKLERDRIDEMSEVCPDDSVSQIGVRQRSYKHYKSYRSRHSSSRKDRYDDVPERKSSRRDDDGESRVSRSSRRRDSRDEDKASHVSERTVTRRRDDDGDSRVSERSDRTARRRDSRDDDGDSRANERSHRHRSDREKEREREKRDHKDRDGEDGASAAGSERSHRSTRSSRSHRDKDYEDAKSSVSRSSKHGGTRIAVKPIPEEDEPNDKDGDNAASKLKKSTMLKQLFKGKLKDYLKEEREKSSSGSSVMV
ncbi:hypothetical protein QBC42DRAFT_347842 [Cladorrhinum samala]|uniref:Uncharacterized protein n=1 Tax=Cladorrhinum samala TaxID=585594 RepID=A0AAV9HIT4_9PEZI|nr:hypothetical protein QBC42DRAFT_347842 [Cladorrhinum samala]